MSKPTLDLTRYHAIEDHGDITLYQTWVGEDWDSSEPCLVLIPTHRQRKGTMQPFCVALSSAYKYDSPKYLLHAAQTACRAMGFTETMSRVYKIAELIHGRLQDLVQMPPRPVEGQAVVADATITDEGGRKAHAELVENQ